MAPRANIPVQPPQKAPDGHPTCPQCGWWDRKLRVVGSKVTTPVHRVALHLWARHGAPFPTFIEEDAERESAVHNNAPTDS